MAEITLPDLSLLWASGGDILQPSNSKIQQGWAPEIPPRQWFNWLDNRQDQALAHIAQHGIAVWSPATEYQASKSYVQGSNGSIYKATTTNTNINPVTDGGSNWTLIATLPVSSAAQAQALVSNTVLLTPLQLVNAFKGANQSLAASGFQRIPGGLVLQWGSVSAPASGSSATIPLPVTYNTQNLFVVAFETSALNSTIDISYAARNLTTSNFVLVNRSSTTAGTTANWLSLGY